MNVFALVFGIYVIFLAATLLLEAYKLVTSTGMVWIMFALFLFAVGIWFAYSYYFATNDEDSSDKTSSDENKTIYSKDESEMEETDVNIEDETTENDVELELIDTEKILLRDSDGSKDPVQEVEMITYEEFKKLIKDSSFLTRFTKSILECLKLKIIRYKKLKAQVQSELSTFTKGDSNDWINNQLQKLRNEKAQSLEEHIERINKILLKIKQRISKTSVEDTRQRLHAALYKKEVGLDNILGRNNIKDFLIKRLYAFSKNPRVFFTSFNNILLLAPPGYGKTTIAKTVGHVLACSGILVEDKLLIGTKEALQSPYVNESVHKTHSFMLSTLEHVVFFDEAYDFVPAPGLFGGHKDHGEECITQLVNDTDKMQGLHVIIMAGYEKEMRERLLTSNKGLDRRFPHQLVLEPYTAKELASILLLHIKTHNKELQWTEEMDNYVYTLIHTAYTQNHDLFPNQAGDVTNLCSDIATDIYASVIPWPHEWKTVLMRSFNNYLSKNKVRLITEPQLA